jgi:hypothetical protein
MGRPNADAVELTRKHCRKGRFELIGGNSMLGNVLRVPMGPIGLWCEHAATPHIKVRGR